VIKDCLIRNFGCIKEIYIDCPNGEDVFIIGDNGTGKTSVLQAISLALSGKTAKKIKISDFVGPYQDDFLIKLTLDDGTRIERKKERGRLILPDNSVFDKITDIYSYLPFDPELFFSVGYVKQGEIAEFFENDKDLIDKLISLIIDMKRIDNGYIIITKSLTSISKEISSLKNVNYEKPNINKDEILKEIEELKSKLVDVDMNELNQQKKLIDNYKYLQSKLSVTEDNLNNILDIQPPTIDIQSAKKYLSNNEKLKEISNALTNIKSKLEAINIYKDEVAPMYKELLNFTPSLWKATYSDNDLKQISDIKHTITLYMTTEEHTDSMDEFNQLISFIKSKWDIDSDSILKAKTMYRHVVEKLKIDVRLNDIMKEINSYHPTPDTLYDIIDDLIKEYTTEYNNKLELYNELNKEPHISSDEFTKISDDWAKYNNYISTKQQYEKDLVTLKAQIYDISQKIKYSEDELGQLMRSAENNKMIMDNISNKENVIRLYELWEKEEASRQQKLVALCNKEEYLSKLKTYFKQLPIVIRHVLFEPIQEIINNDFFDIFSFSNLGKITIDWDKVELRIGDLTYDQLSGAQRCTLALTLRLALLKRLGMHMPLMLIDEPTNHLDSKRISDLVKYFTLLHRQTQMFVATHNVDIIPDLDTIVIDTTN